MLFAYRAAPHHNTGFSPFEMIYRRQLRGPLDLVKDGWLAGDLSQVDRCSRMGECNEGEVEGDE